MKKELTKKELKSATGGKVDLDAMAKIARQELIVLAVKDVNAKIQEYKGKGMSIKEIKQASGRVALDYAYYFALPLGSSGEYVLPLQKEILDASDYSKL